MSLPLPLLPHRLSGDSSKTTYQFDPSFQLQITSDGYQLLTPWYLGATLAAMPPALRTPSLWNARTAADLPLPISQSPLGHAPFPAASADPLVTISLAAAAAAAGVEPPNSGPPTPNVPITAAPNDAILAGVETVLGGTETVPGGPEQVRASRLRILTQTLTGEQQIQLRNYYATRPGTPVPAMPFTAEEWQAMPLPSRRQYSLEIYNAVIGSTSNTAPQLYSNGARTVLAVNLLKSLIDSPQLSTLVSDTLYLRGSHDWFEYETYVDPFARGPWVAYITTPSAGSADTLRRIYVLDEPGIEHDAVLVGGAVVTCDTGHGDAVCRGLRVGGNDRSSQSPATTSATLSVAGTLNANANVDVLAGSTCTVTGTLSAAGSINFNNTAVALSGTLAAGPNPATQGVNVTNGSVLTITGGTVNGYISVSSLSSVILAANSTFNCSAGLGGVLNVATYTLTITGTAAIQCELRLQDGGQVNVSDTVNLIGLTVTIPLNFTPAPETIFLSTPDISPTAGQKLVPLRDGTPPDANNDHWGYSGGLVRDVYTLSDGKDYHLKCYRTSVALTLKMKNNADAVIWCINGNGGTVDVASAQDAAGEKVLDPVGPNVYVKGINNNSVYYDWRTDQRPLDLPVVLRHGTVGVAGSVITYTPEPNPQFVEGFTANLDDILGDEDSDGVANVTVSAVPIDDTPEIEVVTGGMVTINIPFLKDASTLAPTKGSASSPSGGAFVYTAGISAGLDTFPYTALFNGYENSDCNVNVRINSVTGPMHTGSIPNAAPSSLDLVQVSSDSAAAEPSVDEEKDEEDE